jgi:hypothetical protein
MPGACRPGPRPAHTFKRTLPLRNTLHAFSCQCRCSAKLMRPRGGCAHGGAAQRLHLAPCSFPMMSKASRRLNDPLLPDLREPSTVPAARQVAKAQEREALAGMRNVVPLGREDRAVQTHASELQGGLIVEHPTALERGLPSPQRSSALGANTAIKHPLSRPLSAAPFPRRTPHSPAGLIGGAAGELFASPWAAAADSATSEGGEAPLLPVLTTPTASVTAASTAAFLAAASGLGSPAGSVRSRSPVRSGAGGVAVEPGTPVRRGGLELGSSEPASPSMATGAAPSTPSGIPHAWQQRSCRCLLGLDESY